LYNSGCQTAIIVPRGGSFLFYKNIFTNFPVKLGILSCLFGVQKKCRSLLAPTFHLSRITFCPWLLFLGRPDMGIVDNYHSLFTFSSSSWVVLIWLVSLPLQSLRSFTGKTTDSGPGRGRYRSLTSKAIASVVDGYQSCFAFGLHSWAVLTWAVPVAVAVAIASLPARRLPQYDGFGGTCRQVGLFVFRSLSFSCMPGLLPRSPGCTTRRRLVSV